MKTLKSMLRGAAFGAIAAAIAGMVFAFAASSVGSSASELLFWFGPIFVVVGALIGLVAGGISSYFS